MQKIYFIPKLKFEIIRYHEFLLCFRSTSAASEKSYEIKILVLTYISSLKYDMTKGELEFFLSEVHFFNTYHIAISFVFNVFKRLLTISYIPSLQHNICDVSSLEIP